ncbi:unnamed protein product [Parascedosporium putredinis]|uniref:Uncharacterized protein n=1 Tax=Parascedosporium putredinis TaxID=1442378 RepID=A0A9P1H654_9PEZI|nr:unnamed protein product [Parascedosporium putredinis]CAI7997044.1 unnamed protein product [Parascedosporium putredinis]
MNLHLEDFHTGRATSHLLLAEIRSSPGPLSKRDHFDLGVLLPTYTDLVQEALLTLSPFYISALCGLEDYVIWKIEQNLAVLDTNFKTGLLVSCVEFHSIEFGLGVKATTGEEDDEVKDESDHYSTDDDDCLIAAVELRSGSGGHKKIYPRLQYDPFELFNVPHACAKRRQFSLSEIFELMNFENNDALLRLVDSGIKRREKETKEAGDPNVFVSQGEGMRGHGNTLGEAPTTIVKSHLWSLACLGRRINGVLASLGPVLDQIANRPAPMFVLGIFAAGLAPRIWERVARYRRCVLPSSLQPLRQLRGGNALQDLVRFTTFVELPLSIHQSDYSPDNSPWIVIDCSYPGTPAAMLQKYYPGTFAAPVASCAPLHVSGNYWQYWKAIEEVLPRDCSSGRQMIVAHPHKLVSDDVTQDEIDMLMARFEGRENLGMALDVIWRFEEPIMLW